jgi:hypothetical protein
MSAAIFPTEKVSETPPVEKPSGFVLRVLLVSIVVLLSCGGWYYFSGRKPKVAMSVALSKKGESSPRGLWSAGPGQLLLLADGQARLVDLSEKKEKWSVKMPPQPVLDEAWQAAINARFVRLQQSAEELGRKRALLATPADTKAFNAEAAQYHAELAAARAEAANPRAPVQRAAVVKSAAQPAYVFGGDRSAVDKLHQVSDTDAQILEARIAKRSTKLTAWKRMVTGKKTIANSELQKAAAREEEARHAAEIAGLKKDQEELAKLKTPEPPVVEKPEPEAPSFAGDFAAAGPMAAICGDRLWIVDGWHAVAFERSSGTVKADVRLAGAALRIFPDGDTVTVVASAGPDAAQVTRLTSAAPPQSFFFSTGRREDAFAISEGSTTPNTPKLRTEFSVAGGSLLRVEIRLKERRIQTRDAIKAGSDKELEAAAGTAAAHSTDELKAITALIRNDAARLSGDAKERVDDSTYEVVLTRPFEPASAEWTGTLRGHVQVFSTPTLHLITAGTKLLAFASGNQKAWEATLGSPVPIHRSDIEPEGPARPWLEAGGKLFFADGAFLTAFDATSGQVVWRLPSVGIRKLQMDGEGNLYVLSDNLRVETLTYAIDASLRDSVPLTMCVGAADGKIRWQMEKYEDVWASGKDVYVLREGKNPGDLENQVFAPGSVPEARVKIYKLSRGSGEPMWEWFQARRPRAVEVQGKKVALLFGDELQVVSSICW